MDDYYDESLLFEQGKVRITNRRVIGADGRSFPLPQIISAQKELKVAGDVWLTLGVLTGCAIALTGAWVFVASSGGPAPGVGLFLAGAGVALISFLVRQFIKEKWSKHLVTIETHPHSRQTILESEKPVEAELILRAIQVATQVGNDVASFRAVFYHPQLPGEPIRVQDDRSGSMDNPVE